MIEFTSQLNRPEKQAIMNLWNTEYPMALKLDGIMALDHYLAGLSHPEHLLWKENDQLVGWLTVFNRDGGTWFAMMVHHTQQGQGVGTQLLAQIQQRFTRLNGWVILDSSMKKRNGEAYTSPWPFYKNMGFLLQHAQLNLPHFTARHMCWES